MQVLVDGLLTSYEKSGKGKTILVLHGWGDRAAGLKRLQAALAKHFTVIAPDLPGFGGTTAPTSPWGLTDYAAFTDHFIQKVHTKPLYAVIGHSNGGAIAIRGIADGIIKANRLVLLDSAGIRDVYKGRRKLLRMITKTGKVLVFPLPSSLKRRIKHKVYRTIGSDMLVAERLQETFKKIITDDVQADAARLDLPVLLMYGEQDLATPVRYGEIFHQQIVGSTLEVVGDAGHFVHLDQPEKVAMQIEGFLK